MEDPHQQTTPDSVEHPLIGDQQKSKSSLFNIVHLGSSFCLLFIAFNTLQSFESSVNKDLGLWSLSILYLFFSLSGFICGSIVNRIGERISLVCGASTYVIYLLANVYVRIWTLIPASALLGFGAAILWCAQGSYLAKNSTESTLGYHSGIFFGLFMFNAVVGNLIAALVLHLGKGTTFLFIILSIIGGVATLSFIFLRNVSHPHRTTSTEASEGSSLTQTLFLFTEPKMLLLIPVFTYWGFSQSFFFSRIPQAMGEKLLGFVMATFGASDTLGSLLMGRISDRIGKKPVMLVASLCGMIGYALSWEVSKSRPWLFFVIMILLGLADAGYNTQLYALMGIYQPKKTEAAYAYLKLIQSTSTAIAFFYSLFLDLREIIILVEGTLVISIICFFLCDRFFQRVDGDKQRTTVN